MSREITDRDADTVCAAAELARWSAYALTALLLAGAGTLGFRRLGQALQQPLDGLTLLMVSTIAAGSGAIVRLLLRWPGEVSERQTAGRKLQWTVSLCLAGLGISLSLNGTSFAGLMCLWSILIGEELWAWWGVLAGWRFGGRTKVERREDTVDDGPAALAILPHRSLSGRTPPVSEEVLQEFVRSRETGGAEVLKGWVRVALSPGQRSATVHLAFCPPFARTPTITVAQQEGPSARIKEAQVLPFGTRLDLKLSQAADSCLSVLLSVVARGDSAVDQVG